jgi:hypothetical protein
MPPPTAFSAMKPPMIPAKFITSVSSGSATTQAMMRVTARNLNASTALASSASICSVTRIAPSSAPMPAPTRPESSRPVVRGPVSRTSAMASPAGIIASAPNRSSEARVCIESTTPMASPDVAMSGSERHPTSCRWRSHLAGLVRRPPRVPQGARPEEREAPEPRERREHPPPDAIDHGSHGTSTAGTRRTHGTQQPEPHGSPAQQEGCRGPRMRRRAARCAPAAAYCRAAAFMSLMSCFFIFE